MSIHIQMHEKISNMSMHVNCGMQTLTECAYFDNKCAHKHVDCILDFGTFW